MSAATRGRRLSARQSARFGLASATRSPNGIDAFSPATTGSRRSGRNAGDRPGALTRASAQAL
eukprot:8824094-Alexandrium_andersonii.AAC.1